jgi:hypothetical protein
MYVRWYAVVGLVLSNLDVSDVVGPLQIGPPHSDTARHALRRSMHTLSVK